MHLLHVKVEGQHVKGSPFKVTVTSPIKRVGDHILAIDAVVCPRGIAVNKHGELVVIEGSAWCVSVFSPSGEKLRSFGKYGIGEGQFLNPWGVTVDGEENILVADRRNHCILKFTAEGRFLTSVGARGTGHVLQFIHPTDLAFNVSNNKIYVVDDGNNCIQILNSDLTFFSAFGKAGNGRGQFSDVWGIACDNTGKVYIADSGNHRIQVFTAEGKHLNTFGKCGQGRGELDWPARIAIGGGKVYVSHSGLQCVSVFTTEGSFLTSFGRKGSIAIGPCGLAVGDCEVVYVCDSRNCRIEAF